MTELLEVFLDCLAFFRQRGKVIASYLRIIVNGLGAGARAEKPGCGTPLLTTFTRFHSETSNDEFRRSRVESS